jgi:hypothetical protein
MYVLLYVCIHIHLYILDIKIIGSDEFYLADSRVVGLDPYILWEAFARGMLGSNQLKEISH